MSIIHKLTAKINYLRHGTKNDVQWRICKKIASQIDTVDVFVADVNQVRDIHQNYSVTSAPSLLEFQK